MPENVSKEARRLIHRLLDVDYRRRMTAKDLVRDPWIKCSDLPLTVFENAGHAFRCQSHEGRKSFDKENMRDFHNQAIDHLRQMGYSGKEIEHSFEQRGPNKVHEHYRLHVDKRLGVY